MDNFSNGNISLKEGWMLVISDRLEQVLKYDQSRCLVKFIDIIDLSSERLKYDQMKKIKVKGKTFYQFFFFIGMKSQLSNGESGN